MFLPVTEEERLLVEEIKERLRKRHLRSEDMKRILENENKRHTIEEILEDKNDFDTHSLKIATNKPIYHAVSIGIDSLSSLLPSVIILYIGESGLILKSPV